jgi:hypothetical protein
MSERSKRVTNADRVSAGFQNMGFEIARVVSNPRQPATIWVLTQIGWRAKRTTLANAEAWRAYFFRHWPDAPTELIIHGAKW